MYPGAPSSDPYLLQVLGDEVYFVADDGTHGFELWQIDKTSGRAVRLTDKTLGPAHTAIQALALDQGEVVFQEGDTWYGFDSQGVPKELTATPTIDARNNAPLRFGQLCAQPRHDPVFSDATDRIEREHREGV